MNCWVCNTELIWGGDHDLEEENENHTIVTNLSCPSCEAYVEVYHGKEIKNDQMVITANVWILSYDDICWSNG